MAVLKEPITARPTSQHRHSSHSSSIAHSLPKNRPHSHSVSLGSIHPHRITRRKSMSSTAVAQLDPIAAAEKGIVGAPLDGVPAPRRPSKAAAAYRGPAVHSPAMASSVPNAGSAFGPSSYARTDNNNNNHAVTDGPSLATMHEADKSAASKSRIRRASEGARQAKGDGKRTSGSELKCEQCGKGYKHSSCLTKHLWEHTPHWNITSKLLISKHQQVQLLEAASVLVGMHDAESAVESDQSPSPPPASGDSDLRDGMSSTNTTPPPQMEDPYARPPFDKRYSTTSSSAAFSQSYQSAVFSDNGQVGHYRQWSNASDRPTTSGTSYGSYQEDDQSLAAAVHLLSCSNGTPKSGPVALPPDVPPVPPLPAKFMGFNTHETLSGSHMVTPQQSSLRSSGHQYQYHRKSSQDVDMDDDDDDGVFGRMEE